MDVPLLNLDALSRLAANIETNLKKHTNEDVKPVVKVKAQVNKKNNQSGKSKSKVADVQQHAGKKRLRDGQVKAGTNTPGSIQLKHNVEAEPGKSNEHSKPAHGLSDGPSGHLKSFAQPEPKNQAPLRTQKLRSSTHGAPPPESSRSKASNSKRNKSKAGPAKESRSGVSLNDEVLALGGTEQDLDLIENADSESEMEAPSSKTSNGKLVQDLQRLVRDLRVKGVGNANGMDSADEAESPPLGAFNPNEISLKPRKASKGKRETSAKGVTRNIGSLKVEPRAEWHIVELPPLPNQPQPPATLPTDTIDQVHRYAKKLLDAENQEYSAKTGTSSSAHKFYSTIMSAGTLSDKISALTLSVQESPIHNMRALENLVALAKKRSRGQAVEVLGALKDLLGPGSLLPSDRKLKLFAAQPSLSAVFTKRHKTWMDGDPLPAPLQDIHLIVWAYEDWLKSIYFEMLKIIETWANDEIVFARGKAVEYIYELLRDKPEQEANLLRLLVNKLGDSDKKIASKTSYYIIQLETSHPLMKPTIISSIESDLLFRPGQSMHAKYYAVITLNQTLLSTKEEAVAKQLLSIYFGLFGLLLTKQEPAKPDPAASKATTFNKKGERQGGGGAPGKKAQKKLESESKNLTIDDEHREKMLSAVLTGVNRAMPYASADDESFDKHIDTLFRVTHSSNFNTSVQALMLIQQLCGSHQAASDRFYRTLYESLLDPRLLTSSKQAMYLNLVYRALRADLKIKRVEAFAKRLLQVVAMHQPPFACAVLYLLRELEGVFPNLQSFLDQPEEDDSEDEEEFRDVGDDREVDQPARAAAIQAMAVQESQFYDGRKREPEYSNAEKSCLWEIDPFLIHYHPSVALFASKLLTHEVMPAKPDLSMHTLIHFLDRFVYRNPKKATIGPRGASIMQPLAGGDTSSLLVSAQSKNDLKQPVNTEAFWKMDGGKVAADEVFFHKYFNAMGKGKESAKKAKVDKERDADDDSDADENEDEIWEALINSRPELEGSDQSDGGEMDDLDPELGSEADESPEVDEAGTEEDQSLGDDNEGGFTFDDEEALLGSDEELPNDLDMVMEVKAQSPIATNVAASESKKRKTRRKMLKNLPTFASADDYAAMLDVDEEEL
ncbi:hypothetical protein MMC30_002215 [Trapelia coarctata]|nr:hypothetical protein [Trapelia coarctata]